MSKITHLNIVVCLCQYDGPSVECNIIIEWWTTIHRIHYLLHTTFSTLRNQRWQSLSLMLSLSLALLLSAYTMGCIMHTHHNAFCRIWTYDTSVRSRLLYSTELRKQVLRVGFEPTNGGTKTRCLTTWRPQSGVSYGNWTNLGSSTNYCLNH